MEDDDFMDEATREQPEVENAATELLPPVAVVTERLASPERLPLVARPFSRGLTTLLLVGALTLTALAYSSDLALAHEDWSAGAAVAGKVSLGVALLALLVTLLRAARGRRSARALLASLIVIVLFAALGTGGLLFAAPLHGIQARALEAGGQYGAAIHEYALAGERPPNAPNIARTYDEWGEHMLAGQAYAAALGQFSLVVERYDASGAATDRAAKDIVDTYTAWVQGGASDIPFADAVAAMAAYRTSAACDTACRAAVGAVEAQTRYSYGAQLVAAKDYAGAVAQFEMVQSAFPTSDYAARAHTAAAPAYLSLARLQVSSACAGAVAAYRTLTTHYGNTPAGGQAKAALAAPVDVSGTLRGFPTYALPVMHLSRHIDPANLTFSDEYSTTLDPRTGRFTFKRVAQGAYNLSTSRALPVSNEYEYFTANESHDPYAVHVGPVCALDLGVIPY